MLQDATASATAPAGDGDTRMSRTMNIVVAAVILVWAALTTYTEIIDADPNEYSIKSPEVRQALENCTGTFAQRQACAERITDQREQLGFLVWCEKVIIILGPPLVLWGLVNLAARRSRREAEPAAPRRVAAGAAARPRPRPAAGPAARHPAPEPAAPGSAPTAPATQGEGTPMFTGGRREPVRRRDR